jgi:TetR/AcrR family transcriptional regulator, regulator of mycofactocin system
MTRTAPALVDRDARAATRVPSAAERVGRARRRLMEDELIAVARRLFEQRGFDSVSVDEIAVAAGVSNRTFYRYFPAKEEVAVRATERTVEQFAGALAGRLPGQSPLDAIYELLTSRDTEMDEEYVAWLNIASASPSLKLYHKGVTHDRVCAVLAAAFAEHMGVERATDMRPGVIAAAIMGAMDVALERWIVDGGDWSVLLGDALEILRTSLTAPLEGETAKRRRATRGAEPVRSRGSERRVKPDDRPPRAVR